MAIERLRYLIEAVWQGKQATNEAAGDIKKVDEATKASAATARNFKDDMAKLATGFGIVAGGAKLAYEAIQQGAALDLARTQFDNLAVSIGTTSDALLGDLTRATGGMMTNAEMIASASQLISLGLADNQEGVVRLSTAVSTLGLDMQQVILTFANNSKARLDALGLSVEEVTRKAAELEAQGFVGDAFDEAVLIGLEQKMVLLGDATETTAGALQRLAVRGRDAKDSMLEFIAARSEGAILGLANTLDMVAEKQNSVEEAFSRGLITEEQYNAIRRAGVRAYAEQIAGLEAVMAQMDARERETMETNTRFAASYQELIERTSVYSAQVDGATRATHLWKDAQDAASAAALATSGATGGATQALVEQGWAVKDLHDKVQQLEGIYGVQVNIGVGGLDQLNNAYAIWSALQGSPFEMHQQSSAGTITDLMGDQLDPFAGGGALPGDTGNPLAGGMPGGPSGQTPAPVPVGPGVGINSAPQVNINVFGPMQSTPEAIAAKVGRALAPRG